jgi:hypothetical protein
MEVPSEIPSTRTELPTLADGTVEMHEVKGGYIRDDALVKFKVARELYPQFRWRMWQYDKGEWRQVLC